MQNMDGCYPQYDLKLSELARPGPLWSTVWLSMRHEQVQESPRPLVLAAVGENGEFIAAASALLSGALTMWKSGM